MKLPRNPLLPLLAGLLLLVVAGCTADKQAAPVTATPVRVALVQEGPASPAIAATGVVASKDEMRLSFKVGGVLQEIAVNQGQRVRKGQKLAQIELTEVNSQVEQAHQLEQKARRDLERGENLHADQVISLEQLQNLRTQAHVADAQLRAARFNQGYASIIAPRDGVVLRKLAETRELLPAGQVVLVLGGDDGGFVVRTGLSDREVVQLRLGDTVDVRLDAWPDEHFRARVTEIAGAADERSGLFEVEALLDTTARPLVSGLVAKLSLVPGRDPAARLPYVPIGAVLEGDRGTASVFVLDGTTARRREIGVAFLVADSVAVHSGIRNGEQVVTAGAAYLTDGETVAPVKEPVK